mmetsp:Transcript_78272/g.138216  ORF Transcript_78272/g.138216 Transcript_78272/m.138216 type:complete len:205 (+) Transcript_78272:380-994(+)
MVSRHHRWSFPKAQMPYANATHQICEPPTPIAQTTLGKLFGTTPMIVRFWSPCPNPSPCRAISCAVPGNSLLHPMSNAKIALQVRTRSLTLLLRRWPSPVTFLRACSLVAMWTRPRPQGRRCMQIQRWPRSGKRLQPLANHSNGICWCPGAKVVLVSLLPQSGQPLTLSQVATVGGRGMVTFCTLSLAATLTAPSPTSHTGYWC